MKILINFLLLIMSIHMFGQETNLPKIYEISKWNMKMAKKTAKKYEKSGWQIVGEDQSLVQALESYSSLLDTEKYLDVIGEDSTVIDAKYSALHKLTSGFRFFENTGFIIENTGEQFDKMTENEVFSNVWDNHKYVTMFGRNVWFISADEYYKKLNKAINETYLNNKNFKKIIETSIIEDYTLIMKRTDECRVFILINKKKYLSRIRDYIRKDLTDYVNTKISGWSKKGIYETKQNYQTRVTKLYYKAKINEYISEYANIHVLLKVEIPDENFYDADNNVYKLNMFELNSIFFNVSIDEAKSLHSNIDSLILKNARFSFTDENEFIITYIEVTNPENNNTYIFDINNEYKFSNYKSDYVHKTLVFQNNTNEIDITAPEITIISPQLQSTRGLRPVNNKTNQIAITGKAIDVSGVYEVLVNNEKAILSKSGNFKATVNLLPGKNIITVKATDIKKNVAIETYTIEREDKKIVTQNNEIGKGKFYALIIGVQDYINPKINDLDQPISDAKKLYNVLLNNYTFEAQNIQLLKNPTKEKITEALDYYTDKLTVNDNLLIFYAGHGYWDEKFKQGYWLASDADRSKRGTWLSNSTIRDYMQGIPAKHSLLITDACFGGGIFKSREAFSDATTAIKQLYKLPSRKAMTSGALSEVPDKSVFIEYLVKRLQQNKEKYLTSEKLFASFKIAVINNSISGQVPQFGEVKSTGDEGGDFIFIRK